MQKALNNYYFDGVDPFVDDYLPLKKEQEKEPEDYGLAWAICTTVILLGFAIIHFIK